MLYRRDPIGVSRKPGVKKKSVTDTWCANHRQSYGGGRTNWPIRVPTAADARSLRAAKSANGLSPPPSDMIRMGVTQHASGECPEGPIFLKHDRCGLRQVPYATCCPSHLFRMSKPLEKDARPTRHSGCSEGLNSSGQHC
jgi:hypothetical protein